MWISKAKLNELKQTVEAQRLQIFNLAHQRPAHPLPTLRFEVRLHEGGDRIVYAAYFYTPDRYRHDEYRFFNSERGVVAVFPETQVISIMRVDG